MSDRSAAAASAAAPAAAPAAEADQSGEAGQASGAPGEAGASPGGQGAGAPARRRGASWSRAIRLLRSRPVRWGFVAAAIAIGGYAVADEWTAVHTALGRLGFLAVAGAVLSVLVALLATMQVWRVLLAGLGSPLPGRAAARIFFIGQLGKYVPGSIWPVLAQMELGAEYKVPRHRSASASVLTMLLTLLAGLLVALLTLPFVPGSTSYRLVFLAAPVLLVCLHPKVLNRLLDRLLRLARRPALEQPLAGRAIAAALAWAAASWVCYGLQLWLLVNRLGAPDGRAALLALGGFAFAWCVGFVVVFAPAGAGVRDVLLVAMFTPAIGFGAATAAALVSRVALTAGDLITAAAAAGLSRRHRREVS